MIPLPSHRWPISYGIQHTAYKALQPHSGSKRVSKVAVPPSGTTTPPLPAHTAPIDADGVYTDLAIHWSSKLVDLSVIQKSFAVIVTVIVSVIAIVIVWDCYCYCYCNCLIGFTIFLHFTFIFIITNQHKQEYEYTTHTYSGST